MDELIQSFKSLFEQYTEMDQILREYRHSNPIDASKREKFLGRLPDYKRKYSELKQKIKDSDQENYWIGKDLAYLTAFKTRPFIIDLKKKYIHYSPEDKTIYSWFLGGFE